MSRRIATIGLQGALLRYAELDGETSLRRLGTVEFDRDAERTLLGPEGLPLGTALETAVREVFDVDTSGSPDALIVAAHPSHTVSFSTPLPETLPEAERDEHLRQEAALLADVAAGQPVRIRAVPVRTQPLPPRAEAEPEPHRWHHVLYLSESVHTRLSLLARALGVDAYDLIDTTRAAATVVSRLAPSPDPSRLAMAVGVYGGHSEFALMRGNEWAHGHFGLGASAEDTAYFALALLERVGLDADAPERLFAYGDRVTPERLQLTEQMLDLEAEVLDPLSLFSRRPRRADPTQLAAFTPLLGVALGA
ncbi:MAG: hypothetical protein AAF791_06520 [Bacteroidota bacterium]